MGSRFRRRVGVLLLVSAVALVGLAVVAAHSDDPHPILTVDDSHPLVGQVVHFHASQSDDEDEAVKIVAYDFAFGDGPDTGWQTSADASHAYAAAGTYTATVTVKDKHGETGQASREIDVRALPVEQRAPDLVPASIAFSPTSPTAGDRVTVLVGLRNDGSATAQNASVRIFDIGPTGNVTTIGIVSLGGPVVPSASTIVRTAPFVANPAGNHTILVLVEDVSPAENGTSDNVLRATLFVAASPGSGGSGGNGGGLPVSAIVAIALLGTAAVSAAGSLYLLRRRPTPGFLEPPPPEPPDFSPPPLAPL